MRWTDLENAIAQAEWERALDLALEGWREQRVGVLADVVDVIAKKLVSCSP